MIHTLKETLQMCLFYRGDDLNFT